MSVGSGLFNVGGSARRDAAIDRTADLSWNFNVAPTRPLVAEIQGLPGSGVTKRVLFSGNVWLTDTAIAAWREYTPRPGDAPSVTELAVKNPSPMASSGVTQKSFGSLGSPELETVAKRAVDHLKTLQINVTRVFKVNDDANGVLSGKIVAVTDTYAAQTYGSNGLVIHERSKLSNEVQQGQTATMDYKNGAAQVYAGCLFDVDIKADNLKPEERAFLRSRMVEALSSFQRKPENDAAVVEAMSWAVMETAKQFKIPVAAMEKAGLTVEDRFIKPAAPAAEMGAKPLRPQFR